MRALAVIFVLLVLALQYPLWAGEGSWRRVQDLRAQLQVQRAHNAELKARNEALDAEVRDLKRGYAAIEERARAQLGMVKPGEIYFQLAGGDPAPAAPPASIAQAPARP